MSTNNSYIEVQTKLVPGESIRTINGESILGSGDVQIITVYETIEHGTDDTTYTLTPNVFHKWNTVSSLTLTLGAETPGITNEYLFQFQSGTASTTLTLPSDVIWVNDEYPIIYPNCIYQVSIFNNLATMCMGQL
jgi:hypothetical protein